ncbi:MAG: DedA family protein [Planctomycetia bacterium]|nr:DedA family protein [Planctomycetia bacterium]
MIPLIQVLLTRFTYVALALILIAAGCGMPIPEDVPLIFSGYLCNPHQSPLADIASPSPLAAARTIASPDRVPDMGIMIFFGMTGILAGDSILYFVGRHGIDADNFLARHIRKVMHSKRRARVEKYFRKHGDLTLFIGRFIPAVRALIFALCGISRMAYWRFLLVDGLAGLISVPTLIFLGYWQAARINWLFREVATVKHYLYLAAAIGIVIALMVFVIHRRRQGGKKVGP